MCKIKIIFKINSINKNILKLILVQLQELLFKTTKNKKKINKKRNKIYPIDIITKFNNQTNEISKEICKERRYKIY